MKELHPEYKIITVKGDIALLVPLVNTDLMDGFRPHGSIVAHPTIPADPTYPISFSQPMVRPQGFSVPISAEMMESLKKEANGGSSLKPLEEILHEREARLKEATDKATAPVGSEPEKLAKAPDEVPPPAKILGEETTAPGVVLKA